MKGFLFFTVGFLSVGGFLTLVVMCVLYALLPAWLEAHNEDFIIGILWGSLGTRVGLWMQKQVEYKEAP